VVEESSYWYTMMLYLIMPFHKNTLAGQRVFCVFATCLGYSVVLFPPIRH
jgi:hypothetical protein